MRQRLLWLLTHLTLLLSLIALSLAPLNAFAATVPSATPAAAQHSPHFFWKPNVHRPQPGARAVAANNVTRHSGPVMFGTAQVYAIFWEPTGNVSASYNNLLERYFQDVGGSLLYNNNRQYYFTPNPFDFRSPTNSVFAGAWVDRSAYPESPLLDSDIRNEVTKFATSQGGIDAIFFVFTEAGQNLCFDSTQTECANRAPNLICAYHNYFTNSLGVTLIYAAIPYAASFGCDPFGFYPNDRDADMTINVTSHEQMEAATDPFLNAWYDGSTSGEIGDKCAWAFGPRDGSGADVTWNGHNYLVQQEWDNRVSGCVLSGP